MDQFSEKEQSLIEMETLLAKQQLEINQYKLREIKLINSLEIINKSLDSNYSELCQRITLLQKEKIEYQSRFNQIEEEKAKLEKRLKKYQEGIAIGNRKTITFGNYKQGTNGEIKPIEWIVLERKEGEALLLSKDILDCKPYNNNYVETSWKECTLNKWLNDEFYSEAFSKEEQENIIEKEIKTPANLEYKTYGGKTDYNHVFCLSIQKIEQYFGLEHRDSYYWLTEKEAAKAKGSDYAKNATNLYVNKDNGNSYWWTRSPGLDLSRAANLFSNGRLFMDGDLVIDDFIGVRPALWIKTKS